MKKNITTIFIALILTFLPMVESNAKPLLKIKKGAKIMTIENLQNKDRVLDYFIQLAQIPSPSLKEDKVADKIMEILSKNGIPATKDSYGNIMATLEANNNNNAPILLSAHMDVVGSNDPVNLRISEDGKLIETDKTRTLGADDKAGVATILDTMIYFKEHMDISHPKIEAVFTRDEELGMTGIENLDTTKITSQNALILDGSDLGECNVAGASFTNLTIYITEGKSGHSGIDIADTDRVSANKILGEIINTIPQGVYKQNELGVITSINSGVIIGGSAGMYLVGNKNELNIQTPQQIMEEITNKSFRNIISANAYATYSIRSSEPENENQLKTEISKNLDEIINKYKNKIKIEYKFETHLKPFIKDDNEEFLNKILNAAKKEGMDSKPTSFHAGAETHVLQNEKLNANGEKFKPMLLGIADIFNMHSPDEQLDWESLIKGRNWIIEIIKSL